MSSSVTAPTPRAARWLTGLIALGLVALSIVVPSARAAAPIGDYLDTFSAGTYSGSDGSIWWGWPWSEFGDDWNPATGALQVVPDPQCPNGNSDVCLVIGKGGADDVSILRTANLSNADSATLTFLYERHKHFPGAGIVRVKVATSALGPWTTLQDYTLDWTSGSVQSAEFDISAAISPWTTVAFQLIGGTDDSHMNVDDLRIELSVDANVAPVLDPIPNRTIDEQVPFAFTATASDGNASNSLTFSLGGSKPAGAAISAGGSFTWTPTEAQGPGTYTFDVIVTDDAVPALSDSQSVTLTVAEVNSPPTLHPILPASTQEGSQLAFAATADDAETPGNALVFSLSGGPPAGAAITAGGVFSWTPTEAQGPGTYSFGVTVTDVGSPPRSDSQTITVAVAERNEAPTIAPIADRTIAEGTVLAFDVSVSDPDLPRNGFTFSLSGAAPSEATISSTGSFWWEPKDSDGPASHTFDIIVTDDGFPARSDTETLTVNVTEANIPPEVEAVPTKTVAEGSQLQFTVAAFDPDTPPNSFDFSLSGGPPGATITTGGTFRWTPTEQQGPGTYHFDVIATDDGIPPMADSTGVTVVVTEVNTAPTLSPITSRTIDEGRQFNLQAGATDADSPANTLTFSLIGAPNGATISPSGLLSWTPNETQGPGTHVFQVVVTDNASPALTDSQTVTIHVIDANNAPEIEPIGVVNATEGEFVSFTAKAADPDVPANNFVFNTSGAVPPGAQITPAGTFTWTPGETDGPGAYTFDVMVTDDGTPARSSYESVTILVAEANQAPRIQAGGAYDVEAGVDFLLLVTATDPDLPAQSLHYTASGLPEGATLADTGELRWRPTGDSAGDDSSVKITVTDDGIPALSSSATITLRVITANLAPVLAPIGDKHVVAGELLTFTARATDPDGSAEDLRYSLGGDVPVGAVIDGTSGMFSWRPSLAQDDAAHAVEVIVTDKGGIPKSDSEIITITTGRPNVAPVITRPQNQSNIPGQQVHLVIGSADPDAYPSPLVHGAENLPPGLVIDAITGVINGEPGFDGIAGSPHTVTVTVSDGVDTASAQFVWEITGIANPGPPNPTRGAVVSGITEIGSAPDAPSEAASSSIGRSLVLMSRAARASVSEMQAPLLLLLLIMGAFIAFGRVGLVPILRRGARHDGVLRRLDFDTGAGLVRRSSDGADVFVHISAVARRDRRTLVPGDLVTFRTVDGAYRDLVTKLRRR